MSIQSVASDGLVERDCMAEVPPCNFRRGLQNRYFFGKRGAEEGTGVLGGACVSIRVPYVVFHLESSQPAASRPGLL